MHTAFSGKHAAELTQLSDSIDGFATRQYTRDPQAGDHLIIQTIAHSYVKHVRSHISNGIGNICTANAIEHV